MAEALKEYGMFHADGGNVTFIASNDTYAELTWSEVGLGPNDLRDAGLRGRTSRWSPTSVRRAP